MNNLAAAALALTGAATLSQKAIARQDWPPNHSEAASGRIADTLALSRTGQAATAEKVMREAVSIYQKMFPDGHRVLAAAYGALGESLLAQGKVQQAEPLLLQSVRQLGNTLHFQRRLALRRLIRLYEMKGNRVTAMQFEEELAALERRVQYGY